MHFPWKHLALRIVHLPKSATPVSVNPGVLGPWGPLSASASGLGGQGMALDVDETLQLRHLHNFQAQVHVVTADKCKIIV